MDTVAIYSRLSLDRDGTKTSTKRQEADCRAVAKARGWKVAKVFTDSGVSAFNGKARPAFDKMLAAIDAGQVSGVLGWRLDRLGRRPVEIAQLLERLKDRGAFLATADGLDSTTVTGKGMLQMAGVFAGMESENTAARVSRAQLEAAQEGRPAGGGHRAFGYGSDGMTIVEAEADLIREAARHIIAGGSLRSILHDWNARKVRTTAGNAWNGGPLRRMLLSPRIAGLRTYKDEVIGVAAWPAIIDQETHEELSAILNDPARRTSRPGAIRYLLSGFAFCARCGTGVVAAPHRGKRAYACRSSQRDSACGGVRILAEPFEAHVAATILDALDSPALTKMRRTTAKGDHAIADMTKALRRDEAALERLSTDHYVEGRIGRREFLAAHGRLVERIEATRRELGTHTAGRAVASLPSAGVELRAMWDAADLEWRRQLIAAVIERIEVGPSKARGQTDLSRVGVVWRA
jgi:site-specific DNA recombinase